MILTLWKTQISAYLESERIFRGFLQMQQINPLRNTNMKIIYGNYMTGLIKQNSENKIKINQLSNIKVNDKKLCY